MPVLGGGDPVEHCEAGLLVEHLVEVAGALLFFQHREEIRRKIGEGIAALIIVRVRGALLVPSASVLARRVPRSSSSAVARFRVTSSPLSA
jgi:hypothetical protein